MKKFLEQLKPQERRWVIGLAAGAFLLFNYVAVWPHFKDWKAADVRKQKAEKKLTEFRAEIAHQAEYKRQIGIYESQGGSVPAEDQMEQFSTYVQNVANLYSVYILNNSQPHTYTNSPFFIDREMSLTVLAKEESLVNFLYALGSSNSVMRVKAMSVRPDGPHEQLSANVTILASYQKKAPAPAPPPAKKPAASATPATTPATRPAATHINMPSRTNQNANVKPGPNNAKKQP